MEATLTGLLCPSCEKDMAFNETTHSYRCLACNPIPVDVPTCKTQICKQPLTRLGEPWNCWICLRCNTHPSKVSSRQTERPERKYIDRQMTEERVKEIAGDRMTAEDVRNIVIEAMAEFSTKPEDDPDYPPTREEIDEIVQLPESQTTIKPVKPETWLQKAKRLGVQTHNEGAGGIRKKVDIMADIEAKERSTEKELLENIKKVDKAEEKADARIPEELRTEEQG